MLADVKESLESIKSSLPKWNKWIYQHSFSSSDRIEFYEMLAFLLENEKPLKQALSEMKDVATDFGKKKHPSSVLLTDCIDALSNGDSIEVALLNWVPAQEAMLIGAGVIEGRISESLRRASRIVEGKSEMVGAIKSAIMYPCVLFVMIITMMYMVNDKFIPKMSQMVPREKWTGAVWLLGNSAEFVIGNGAYFIALTILLIALTYWSMDNYTGHSRRFLDKVSPWSLYRIFQGVSFLLNMSALLRVNTQTLNAINIINENASPWMQQRLNATKRFIKQGKHLGIALKQTGYDFPSKECVNQMTLLTDGDGSESVLESYANRWLIQSVKSVKKKALRLTVYCLILVFAYMLLLLIAISQVNDLVQSMGH